MSKAARSVFLFSIYLMAVGILLVLVPNLLLRIFLLPQTDEVWIRILGMLAFILGYYYLQASEFMQLESNSTQRHFTDRIQASVGRRLGCRHLDSRSGPVAPCTKEIFRRTAEW